MSEQLSENTQLNFDRIQQQGASEISNFFNTYFKRKENKKFPTWNNISTDSKEKVIALLCRASEVIIKDMRQYLQAFGKGSTYIQTIDIDQRYGFNSCRDDKNSPIFPLREELKKIIGTSDNAQNILFERPLQLFCQFLKVDGDNVEIFLNRRDGKSHPIFGGSFLPTPKGERRIHKGELDEKQNY